MGYEFIHSKTVEKYGPVLELIVHKKVCYSLLGDGGVREHLGSHHSNLRI